MQNGDDYLIKLKNAGWTDEEIAKRMGIEPQEVKDRFAKIIADGERSAACGYMAFCKFFVNFTQQYQALGESITVIAKTLGELLTKEEIMNLLTDDKEKSADNLATHAIILRPFVPPTQPPTEKK